MVYYLVAALYVLACLLLLLVVLLQQGKGGDIASAFGGGGSQTAFGARAGATVLTKATAVLGALFMLGAVMLSVMGRGSDGSLMRGITAPAPAQTNPLVPQPQGATDQQPSALPSAQQPASGGPAAGQPVEQPVTGEAPPPGTPAPAPQKAP